MEKESNQRIYDQPKSSEIYQAENNKYPEMRNIMIYHYSLLRFQTGVNYS